MISRKETGQTLKRERKGELQTKVEPPASHFLVSTQSGIIPGQNFGRCDHFSTCLKKYPIFRPHSYWVCVEVVQVFPQLRLHNVIYQPDMFDPHTVTFPCSFAIQPPSLILGLRGSGPIIPWPDFPTKSPPSTLSSQCHTSYQPDLFKPHKVTFLVLPNSHLHSSVTLNMQSSCYVQRKGIQFESSRFVHLQLDVLPSLGSGPFL